MTRAESKRLGRVAELGCAICRRIRLLCGAPTSGVHRNVSEVLYQAEGELRVLAGFNGRSLPQVFFAGNYLSHELEQLLLEAGFEKSYRKDLNPHGLYRITVERIDA